MRAHLPAVCAALAILGGHVPARADRGEVSLAPGVGVAIWTTALPTGGAVERLAVQGGLEVAYALTDFWQLAATARGGPAFLGDPRVELGFHATLEARYLIDALTWVPYLAMGAGVLVRSLGPDGYAGGTGPATDLTLHLGFGIDYRPARAWSVGAVVRYHLTVTDISRTSFGPLEPSVRVAFYFD